jgi:hypothetical protein
MDVIRQAPSLFWRAVTASARKRPPGRRILQFDLFGYIWCVIYLNPEVSDGALQLRVAEEKLHRAEIAGLMINLGGLCTPHRVGAIKG